MLALWSHHLFLFLTTFFLICGPAYFTGDKFAHRVADNYLWPGKGTPFNLKPLQQFWKMNGFIFLGLLVLLLTNVYLLNSIYILAAFSLYILTSPFLYLYTRKAKRFRIQAEADRSPIAQNEGAFKYPQ